MLKRALMAIGATVLVLVNTPTGHAEPPPCALNSDGIPECGADTIVVTNPGASQISADTGTTVGPPDPCRYEQIVPHPDAGDPRWAGSDAAAGELYGMYCPVAVNMDELGRGGLVSQFVGYAYAATGSPVAVVSAEALAQRALGEMQLPVPELFFGPDESLLAVNYWVVLAVKPPGDQVLTVSAGAVSVTAVAEIGSVTWNMGEPVDPDTSKGLKPPLVCDGAGLVTDSEFNPKVQPPSDVCAYMYQWRSLKERTNGVAAWPVSATVTWTVNWSATTGESGVLSSTTAAATELVIGEWRGTVVNGPR